MATEHYIDPDEELGVITFSGTVTGKDLVSSTQAFFSDERWRTGYRILWDARAVERLILEPTDSAEFALMRKKVAPQAGPGRTAVLTDGFEVYASALILKVYSPQPSGREVRLCKHVDDALAWLGLDHLPADERELVERSGREAKGGGNRSSHGETS